MQWCKGEAKMDANNGLKKDAKVHVIVGANSASNRG